MSQQPGQEDHQPHPLRDFKEYQNALFTALTGATRAANAIPIADLGYFRSLDRGFAKTLDSCSEKVLKLSNSMLKYASVEEAEAAPRFYDIDDVMDRYNIAIDVVDNLLEKAVSESRCLRQNSKTLSINKAWMYRTLDWTNYEDREIELNLSWTKLPQLWLKSRPRYAPHTSISIYISKHPSCPSIHIQFLLLFSISL